MDLTREELDSIAKELDEKWKDNTCEVCKNNKWGVNPKIFALKEFHIEEKDGEKVFYTSDKTINPLLLVACQNCGNTKTINALIFGALKDKTSQV